MMGTFTLSYQDSSGDPPLTASVTTADTNGASFLAWAASVYFPLGVLVTPADPTTSPPTAAVYRAPTPAEIFSARFAGLWEGEKANVDGYLKAQAMAAAAAAVTTIS